MDKPADIHKSVAYKGKTELIKALQETVIPGISQSINPQESRADSLMEPLYQRGNSKEEISDRVLGRGVILTKLTEWPGVHLVNEGEKAIKNGVEEQQFPVPAGHILATIAKVMPYQASLGVYDFAVNPNGKHTLERIYDLREEQWFKVLGNYLRAEQ